MEQNKEKIFSLQVAFFFRDLLDRPEELWQPLNTHMGGIFNQTPIIVPVPREIPFNEVPILQMKSIDGYYSCNIGRKRADFLIIPQKNSINDESEIFSDFSNKVETMANFFLEKLKVLRIGFVVRFFMSDINSSITVSKIIDDDFKKIFNRGGAINNSRGILVNYSNRFPLGALEINNIVNVSLFSLMGTSGILITRDFNTIPEANYSENFTPSDIKGFIDACRQDLNIEQIKEFLWKKR